MAKGLLRIHLWCPDDLPRLWDRIDRIEDGVINSSQGFQAFILKLCTAVKSILKMCMCFVFFAHKIIIFDKITAILTLTFQTLVSSID